MKNLSIIIAALLMLSIVSCKKTSKQPEPEQFNKMELTFARTGEKVTINSKAELKAFFDNKSKQAFEEHTSDVLAKKKSKIPMYLNVVSATQSLSANITGGRSGTTDNYTATSDFTGLTSYYRAVAAFDADGTFHESDIYQLRYLPCTDQWPVLTDSISGSRVVSSGEYKRYWLSVYGIDCATGVVHEVYGELILQ